MNGTTGVLPSLGTKLIYPKFERIEIFPCERPRDKAFSPAVN